MKKLFAILFVWVLVFSCSDPYEDDITLVYEAFPVATHIEGIPEKFSEWTALLRHAGLFNTMNLKVNYTCFIPENDAMQRYLNNNGYSEVSDIPAKEAAFLVKYHTIQGTEYSQSFFANGVLPDTTATGDYIRIEIREGGLNAVYVNGEARIRSLDIEATNGIIHSLEEVLIPVNETVWDRLNTGEFTIFQEAATATDYAEMLNTISFPVFQEELGYYIQRRRFFTCFAVPDEVFQQHNISNLNDLVQFVGADTNYKDKENELNRFIAYHLLDQQLGYSTLAEFQDDAASKNLATMAKNELINASEVNGEFYINFNSGDKTGVRIVQENISAKNGMIHIVDNLMPIKTPPLTKVIWELTNYAEIASLFTGNYQNSGLTSTFLGQIKKGDVSIYNWEAMPAEQNDYAVQYYVANRSNTTPHNMMNHDCLLLRLGLYGWIELETPPIVRGTYRVHVHFLSDSQRGSSGKFMTILNGQYLGSEITTHGLSSADRLESAVMGIVSFDETTTHTLRILATDNSPLYIDHIEFEPPPSK